MGLPGWIGTKYAKVVRLSRLFDLVEEHILDKYMKDAERDALKLDNRGPLRFGVDGRLDTGIAEAFSEYGFYVFENVIKPVELEDLRDDIARALARAPVGPDSRLDCNGDSSIGADLPGPSFSFARPLSDPLGGTDMYQGRHPVKMVEHKPARGAPEYTVELLLNVLRLLDSCLRLYGHPEILRLAENLLGPDFLPFNENIFVKEPGLGAAVAWHQDGTTHWNSPDRDELSHGYNNQVQVYDYSAENALWVLPGSHRLGKVDIRARLAGTESDRLPGAVPILCGAGDVSICNRQAVHGSFPNCSADRRWSITYGFLPRDRVVGVTTKKLDGSLRTYDDRWVSERAGMIPLAVDARRQRYPDERNYRYQPTLGLEAENMWNEQARERIKTYHLQNVHI